MIDETLGEMADAAGDATFGTLFRFLEWVSATRFRETVFYVVILGCFYFQCLSVWSVYEDLALTKSPAYVPPEYAELTHSIAMNHLNK